MDKQVLASVSFDGIFCNKECDFYNSLWCKRHRVALKAQVINPYTTEQVISPYRCDKCREEFPDD